MHNKTILTLTLCASLAATLLAGCDGSVLDYRNAQINNGKVYAGDANEPFSGKLTNVPDRVLLIEQAGFQLTGKVASIALADTLPAAERNAQSFLGRSGAETLLSGALCDVQIDNGLPDGKAVCKAPQSDVVRIEASFKHGALDGALKLSGGQDNGPLMQATFKDGHPDGKQSVYSWTNHALVHTFPWSNGVVSGTEEAFDAGTGALVKRATFVGGKYDGEVVHYAPDGKQVILKATYANGKLNGPYREWDASGTLIADKTYSNGVEVGADGSRVDECVQSWEQAEASQQLYAQEAKGVISGSGAPTPEQRSTWSAACRAGRHPDPAGVTQAAQAAKNAVADVDRCVSAKKAAYRSSHGMGDGLAIMDSQIMEFRQQCYAEVQSSSTVATPASQSGVANAAGSPNGGNCVSSWTAAYHRENGNDAIVTVDQLGEWQSWCKEGKRPG